MSNINVRNSSTYLEFLGDYEMESIEMKNGDELNGEAIMRLLIDGERYEMSVNMKNGKKEGVGEILREDGTLFMRMMFVNDECEGEVIRKNEYGSIVLKGRMGKGKKVGMWIEYDDYGNEIWRGFYRNGVKDLSLKEHEGMSGLWREVNENGELLSVSEYNEDGLLKNGKCFEYEGGRMVRECEYKNGVMIRVLREWKGECMIEYDVNGIRVYEGEFEGDMMKGFVREGEGCEFGIDGESALYYGGWKNGLRDGYGSEFKGLNPVYIGEWKNGMKHGSGEELNENEEVVRRGKWIEGEYDGIKRFKSDYGSDLDIFDSDCLKGIEKLEIENDCFLRVNEFVLDGLNELKSVIIGQNCFKLNDKNRRSKCVIMNCNQLCQVQIGCSSFWSYQSFELKNLPSLVSIQLDGFSFYDCHSIVFESMSD